MPLDVGNTWHYAVQENQPGAPVSDQNRTIIGHQQITDDGRTITVAVEIPDPSAGKIAGDKGRLLRNEDDGLYTYGGVDSEGTIQVTGRGAGGPSRRPSGGPLRRTAMGDSWSALRPTAWCRRISARWLPMSTN